MTYACPGTACPRFIGQMCVCPPHDPPEVRIAPEVWEPGDWERLDRAGRSEPGDHIPGVLPPGYEGITE